MANDDFERALGAARRLAEDYLDGLRERPVARAVDPAALAAALDEPLPERGCDPAAALDDWWRRAEPGIVASPGPRFFGFVNGGATPAALAGAWLHVDAAFGLFAALAPKHAHLLRGIERADSVAADAHKWLNVPYDCGFAFVRDAEALRAAFRSTAAYLAVEQPVWNPSSHVPESSRRFRALALWCALKADGRAGIRAMVERGIANAAEFAAWAKAEEGLTLMSPATLNIVCFRLAPADRDEHAADDLNRRAVRALQADGRVFVSGTVWAGRAAIRAAFDNWMTGAHDVAILKQAVADVRDRLLEP